MISSFNKKNSFNKPVDASSLSDQEIITLCLNGNKDCFESIVSRYKNLVYSVVLRMINDHEEANDLSQEIFIKLYKNLDKYSPEYKLSTWIIRISTNHVIDYRRKKKHETVPIDDVEYEITSSSTPEDEYIRAEEKNTLRSLIDSLPDMYKAPIVMYHTDGLSYQEIADATSEPLSKVKNRIFRGRKILKEGLLRLREGGRNGLQSDQ
ncbi:MAG: sigma-70 family RNA polymerase sigma factor [Firmicutes bacterium]|nr:sigma-70 family RNA polymerase sigma factor [Bacillota bacterium]